MLLFLCDVITKQVWWSEWWEIIHHKNKRRRRHFSRRIQSVIEKKIPPRLLVMAEMTLCGRRSDAFKHTSHTFLECISMIYNCIMQSMTGRTTRVRLSYTRTCTIIVHAYVYDYRTHVHVRLSYTRTCTIIVHAYVYDKPTARWKCVSYGSGKSRDSFWTKAGGGKKDSAPSRSFII